MTSTNVFRNHRYLNRRGAARRGEARRCDAMRCDAMRCDAMRCDAMRCDAMRCDAMRCDAMRCDAMRCDAMRYITSLCTTVSAIKCIAVQYNNTLFSHERKRFSNKVDMMCCRLPDIMLARQLIRGVSRVKFVNQTFQSVRAGKA